MRICQHNDLRSLDDEQTKLFCLPRLLPIQPARGMEGLVGLTQAIFYNRHEIPQPQKIGM